MTGTKAATGNSRGTAPVAREVRRLALLRAPTMSPLLCPLLQIGKTGFVLHGRRAFPRTGTLLCHRRGAVVKFVRHSHCA